MWTYLAWLRYAVMWLSVLREQVQVLAPLSVQCLSSRILLEAASKQQHSFLFLSPFQKNTEQSKPGRL